jgi:hypothetical protein
VSQQSCRRGRRPVVDGEEGSRLTGHLAMLPGSPAARPNSGAATDQVLPLGVVRDVLVRVL